MTAILDRERHEMLLVPGRMLNALAATWQCHHPVITVEQVIVGAGLTDGDVAYASNAEIHRRMTNALAKLVEQGGS